MQHVLIWFMNVEWVIVWCNLIDTGTGWLMFRSV